MESDMTMYNWLFKYLVLSLQFQYQNKKILIQIFLLLNAQILKKENLCWKFLWGWQRKKMLRYVIHSFWCRPAGRGRTSWGWSMESFHRKWVSNFLCREGWIFGCWRKNQSRNSDVNNYILATTVSSKILNSIALFKNFILKKHYQILNGLEVG